MAGVDAAEDGMTATLAPGILNMIVGFAHPRAVDSVGWVANLWFDDDDDDNDNGTRKSVLDPSQNDS